MSYIDDALSEFSAEEKADFLNYHKENPKVWRAFEYYAAHAMMKGVKVGSMAVVNRIRWESEIEKPEAESFKINNNYAPYYARVFNAKYKKAFFETREAGDK